MVNSWLKNTQFFCYPPRCVLCGGAGEAALDLCLGCRNELADIPHPCYQCGLPLSGLGAQMCGACLKKPPQFDHVVCGYLYQQPLSALVQELKFQARLQHARVLAQLMLERLVADASARPEVLIPVPLHASRTRERGFNQAQLLAHLLSQSLGISVDTKSCQRKQPTQAQSELNAAQRLVNLRGAFVVTKPLAVSHVALIDDVMTTGSTANELARVLPRAGVTRVDVWLASRAV